jgi:hypothetical protein
VIVDEFLGQSSMRKSGGMGLDGYTPAVLGGHPIQVKQRVKHSKYMLDTGSEFSYNGYKVS